MDKLEPSISSVSAATVVDREPPPTDDQSVRKPQEQELDEALIALRDAARSREVDLDFRIERDLNVIVVTVNDAKGEKVLRQIPPEEAIRLAKLFKAGRQQLLDQMI